MQGEWNALNSPMRLSVLLSYIQIHTQCNYMLLGPTFYVHMDYFGMCTYEVKEKRPKFFIEKLEINEIFPNGSWSDMGFPSLL